MAVPDIQDDALPESLYHYTDAAGLLGILDNNSLYATHVAYLNDSQELIYGMQMAVDELAEWLKSSPKEAMKGWDPALPGWLISGMVKATAIALGVEVQKRTKILRQNFGPFVTCLSESRNQLSQWRGYGRGGGYAIRFDARRLHDSAQLRRTHDVTARAADSATELGIPLGEPQFMKMVYGRETQLEIVRGQLFEAINKLAPQFKTKKQSAEELAQTRGLAEQLLKQLVASVMRVKNPGFEEEQEYRVATFFTPADYSASEIGLIPRVEFRFDSSCVREVLIGPGLHMGTRKSSVEYYLATKLDAAGQKYSGIEVTESETPYRGD